MTAQAHIESAGVRRELGRVGTVPNGHIAGALFFLLGVAFLTGTMLAASIAPGYDFNAAAISDLGTIDETAALFNGLLIVVGALNLAGGYFLFRMCGSRWLFGVYLIAAIGAVGAGLVPLDAGAAHSVFALLAFLFFNVEAIATGRHVRGAMKAISLAAGTIGLAYLVLMVIGDAGNSAVFGPIGHGGSERLIAYPVMLWLVAYGGYLLGSSRGVPTAPVSAEGAS